jgi:hypothetical protein
MKQIVVILIFLFFSKAIFCQNIKVRVIEIPQSSKKLDIPKYPDGEPFVYWLFSKQKEKQLNLNGSENSNDSILLRIWAVSPIGKKNQRHDLFEFRFNENNCSVQFINMSVNLNKRKREEKITNYYVNTFSSNINCKVVIDSLFFYKIDLLPTDNLLPDYDKKFNYYNYETTFCFEFSTPTTYRFYQYNNLPQLIHEYWQACNISDFLIFLDREFKLDSLATIYNKKIKDL